MITEELFKNLNKNDYIKYFRIDKLFIKDDCIHFIIYKKNRKNKGTLTVMTKSYMPDYCVDEYTRIEGHSVIISDIEKFENFVLSYIRKYSLLNTDFANDGYDYYAIKIKFSNNFVINELVTSEVKQSLTNDFYNSLSNYRDDEFMKIN